MRLTIKTSRVDNQDIFLIKIGIINTNNHDVLLIGDSVSEEVFSDFLKSKIRFITFPEILPRIGQTVLETNNGSIPKILLKPQQEYVISWNTKSSCLKIKHNINESPCFSYPGLYGVRACMEFINKSNKIILLYSNEVQIVIGGSSELPKHVTGRIICIDTIHKMVSLNLGSIHGIIKGDKFFCIEHGDIWNLIIIEATDDESLAIVETNEGKGGSPPPSSSLPPLYAFVRLR